MHSITKQPIQSLSFSSIRLNEEERIKTDNILQKIQTNPKKADKLKNQLYTDIFEKHIQKETEKKAGKLYYQDDLLQEMCLKFFELLADIKNTTTENIVNTLNEFKPNSNTVQEQYRFDTISLNTQIGNKEKNFTLDTKLTEDDVPVYSSNLSNEEKQVITSNLKKVEIQSKLTQREKNILKIIKENKSQKEISQELGISPTITSHKKASAIAKMQDTEGTLPEYFNIYTNILTNKYKLSSKENKTLHNVFVKNTLVINTDLDKIVENINQTSSFLNIEPRTYIKACLKQPPLFCLKAKTVIKNTKELANELKLSLEEIIPIGLKQPQLFCLKAKTVVKNITELANELKLPLEEIIPIGLKHPQLFVQKPETLVKNIIEFANELKLPLEEIIPIGLKQPQLFIQKPKTLMKNIKEIANKLNLPLEQIIQAGLKQPSLFCLKSSTVLKNITTLAKNTNTPIEDIIQAGLKHPTLFCRKPESVTQKIKINKFYKFIQNKNDNKLTIRFESNDTLYKRILIYLIKDSDKLKKRIDENNLPKYLLEHNKTYNFEIPEHELKKEFIEFVKKYSINNFQKELFKIK